MEFSMTFTDFSDFTDSSSSTSCTEALQYTSLMSLHPGDSKTSLGITEETRKVQQRQKEIKRLMSLHVVKDVPIEQCEKLIPQLPDPYEQLPQDVQDDIETLIAKKFGDKVPKHWHDDQIGQCLIDPVFQRLLRKGFRLVEGRVKGPGGDLIDKGDYWVESDIDAKEVSHAWAYVRFMIEASGRQCKDGEEKAVQLFRYFERVFQNAPFTSNIYGLVMSKQTVSVVYTDQETGYISVPLDLRLNKDSSNKSVVAGHARFLAKYLYHTLGSLQRLISLQGMKDGKEFILEQKPTDGPFYRFQWDKQVYHTPSVSSSAITLYGKNTLVCKLYDECSTPVAHLRLSWGPEFRVQVDSRFGVGDLNSQGSFFELQDNLGHYGEPFVYFWAKLGNTLNSRPHGNDISTEDAPRKKPYISQESVYTARLAKATLLQAQPSEDTQIPEDGQAPRLETANIVAPTKPKKPKIRHCELIISRLCTTYREAYMASSKREIDTIQWIRSAMCYSILDYATTKTVHGDFSLQNMVLCGKDDVLRARLIDPEFVTSPDSSADQHYSHSGTIPFVALAVRYAQSPDFIRDLCHELESGFWGGCVQAYSFRGFRTTPEKTQETNPYAVNIAWEVLVLPDSTSEAIMDAKKKIAWTPDLTLPYGLPLRYEPFLKLLKKMHNILFGEVYNSQMKKISEHLRTENKVILEDWMEISRDMQARQLDTAVALLKCMDEYLAVHGNAKYETIRPAQYETWASLKALKRLLERDESKRKEDNCELSSTSTSLLKSIEQVLNPKAGQELAKSTPAPKQDAARGQQQDSAVSAPTSGNVASPDENSSGWETVAPKRTPKKHGNATSPAKAAVHWSSAGKAAGSPPAVPKQPVWVRTRAQTARQQEATLKDGADSHSARTRSVTRSIGRMHLNDERSNRGKR